MTRILPFLWFDDQAEVAAKFYTGIFPDSRIVRISRYGEAGREVHGRPAGSVMVVEFELAGQLFAALNGGPAFSFNESISFAVQCDTQEEVDYYWERLGADGDPNAQQCGWLKDRFGVSWQIVPSAIPQMMSDPDPARSDRVMETVLGMKKLDIAKIQRAFAG